MIMLNKYYKACVGIGLSLSILLSAVPAGAAETAAQDDWKADIEIGSAEELADFSEKAVSDEYTKGKNIVLTADIDLSGREFKPIAVIAGTFDGNGHKISGFEFFGAASETGFIKNVAGSGTVENLTVAGKIAPEGNAVNIGGIAGVNSGFIKNCVFEGSLVAEEAAGGIAGHNEGSGQISGCENKAVILAKRRTGGVAGFNEGVIDTSNNSGSVNHIQQDEQRLATYRDKMRDNAGTENLEKFNPDDIDILNGDVKEKLINDDKIIYTGGIAGASSGIIRNCRNSGETGCAHLGYNTGGIVGYERGIIYGCSNSANISGRKNVGGIIGQFEPYVENIYKEDSFDKSSEEINKMNELMDGLNDIAQNADDETQGKIDDIRGTVDELRGTVSGYKSYYRSKDDITEGEIRGKVDALRAALDGIHLKDIETADYLSAIKADMDKIVDLIRNNENSASTGLAIDMSAYISAIKKLNGDIYSEIRQIHAVGNRVAKNAGELKVGLSDALKASEALDDYLRGAYDSYKTDIRGTDDDITSKTDRISEEMDILSDSLKNSDRQVRNQMDKLVSEMNLLNDTLHDGFDELDEELTRIQNTDDLDDVFDDVSDTKDTDPGKGKVVRCINNGYVNSDINGGGVVGFAGVDINLQSDFEVVSGGQISLKYSRTKQATITECKNYSGVDVRNSYAGGIVGRMDVGAVISSENYGMIMNKDGDYTGGIAGYAKHTIRNCYAMQTLSGNNYIGGIAGEAGNLYDNKSMTKIDGEGERYGAIGGILTDDENSTASGNLYVDYGIAAINGLTMSNEASEISYDRLFNMEGTPGDFGKVRVTFIAGDQVLDVIEKPYGGSISYEELPKVITEGNEVAFLDDSDLENIRQNIVIRVNFEKMVTTIASEEPFPVLLVSGNFLKDSSIAYEKYDAAKENAENPYECVDKYIFQIKSEHTPDEKDYTVRVLADDYKDWYSAALEENGKIVPVKTEWDGRYMVFSMNGDGTFYIVRSRYHYLPYIIAGIVAFLLLLGVFIVKKLKKVPQK